MNANQRVTLHHANDRDGLSGVEVYRASGNGDIGRLREEFSRREMRETQTANDEQDQQFHARILKSRIRKSNSKADRNGEQVKR